MKDIKNDLQKFDTWKIQLTLAIKFLSSKENDEEHTMHSTNDNIDEVEVIKELFELVIFKLSNWFENISEKRSYLSLIVFIYCITNVLK